MFFLRLPFFLSEEVVLLLLRFCCFLRMKFPLVKDMPRDRNVTWLLFQAMTWIIFHNSIDWELKSLYNFYTTWLICLWNRLAGVYMFKYAIEFWRFVLRVYLFWFCSFRGCELSTDLSKVVNFSHLADHSFTVFGSDSLLFSMFNMVERKTWICMCFFMLSINDSAKN